METDKNRLISEKNVLVTKREKLRKKIAALQQNTILQRTISLPLLRSSNRETGEIAPIFKQDKLKARILNTFNKTKKTFKRFLIQIKVYHQFHTINLSYLNNKVLNIATFIKDNTLKWIEPLFRDFFEYNNNNQNPLTRKMFGSYKNFEVKLKTVFKKINKKKAVKKQLVKLKQTGSASHYTVQFRQIILRLH